jgi:DNA-binding NarL/FixJ family response regulator
MAEGWSLADGSAPSAEAAHRAVELLSASGCRGIRARALEQLAQALLATDAVSARAAFEEATTLFRECGAVWRLDRARELKRAFYSHRTSALRGDDLSARERQVARLAVDGLTAREIGEQLFISSRTVETHLANVYAKLGVRSKIELVGRASELALNQ